jgi:hypothetical protein
MMSAVLRQELVTGRHTFRERTCVAVSFLTRQVFTVLGAALPEERAKNGWIEGVAILVACNMGVARANTAVGVSSETFLLHQVVGGSIPAVAMVW